MITILVALLQITIIGLIVSVASKSWLQRSPETAARICWLGIMLSAVVVVCHYFQVPRLWTLQPQSAAPNQLTSTAVTPSEMISDVAGESESSGAVAVPALKLDELFGRFCEFQRRHQRVDARLVAGCSGLATFLGLIVLGRCIIGGWWLWRLRKSEPLPEDSAVHQELATLVSDCDIRMEVSIRRCASVASPCVSWWDHGAIYVPLNFAQWSSEERIASLAHELAHKIRRDPQFRFAAELCLSLLCYHPLMLLLRRRLVFAQELATDRRAAGLLGSLNTYQRGLSMLALRMDSLRSASYLVSVSTSDVIRRIKMLKSKQSSFRRWQEVVSVLAVLSACILAAVWTAEAEDPVRATTVSRTGVSGTAGQELAQHILPWETLGEQSGYVVLQPSVLAKHPVARLGFELLWADSFGQCDLPGLGLYAENIESMLVPLVVNVSEVPESERANHDGHRHRLTFGADAIAMSTKEPVVWMDVVDTVRPQIGNPEASEWLQTAVNGIGRSTEMRLVSDSARDRTFERFSALKSVWMEVSDCSLALATATPKDLGLRFDQNSDEIGACNLFAAVETTSLGVDLDAEDGIPRVRIVFQTCAWPKCN